MTSIMQAHVRNGHIVVDSPTDLPEGTVVFLRFAEDVGIDREERIELERSLDEGFGDFSRGDYS